jgi:nucleoside-diphosphate-sugar epimerase
MVDRYLVTGGAGFIGSNIVEKLIELGKSIRVLDNLSTGSFENLASILSKIEFIEGDIRDLETVQKAMDRVDYVLHQAAIPSVPRSIEAPLNSHDNNITGTLNALIAAQDNHVKRFVYASSSSVYGDTPQLPKKEEMPPSPLSPYAVNKFTGEHYCRIFSSIYGLETISLRYFNVFGPHQDPASEYAAVIPKFINSLLRKKPPVIYGDGEQTRDFTFVENVVSANILATQVKITRGELINVATGTSNSVNQLLENLQLITGQNISPEYIPARLGDVRHSLADITKARKILNYQPAVSLTEGLKLTVEWFNR